MDYTNITPIRVMALHALAYCERLFYLEEVEEIRLADSLVYEGRALHEELKKAEEERGEWTSMELESERLGIFGKVDALRERDGALIPYEHKKGRPRREGDEVFPWFPDALQISAYGMLLEDVTKRKINEGRIRYHGENITVRVPLDDRMRNEVLSAISRARELVNTTERPPVTENDRLCTLCSLAPVCLPEEVRFVRDPSCEPVRLFPASVEGIALHITEPGTHISRSGDMIKVYDRNEGENEYPIMKLGSVILHGYPQITTQALHFLARNGIIVHWLSPGGFYISGLANSAGTVQRRIRQYQALSNPGICLRLSKRLSMAKVESALRFVLRATRGSDREATGISDSIKRIRESLSGISKSEGVDSIRGYEGSAGRAYFSIIPSLLREDVPSSLCFTKRSRRPPKDPFNTLLSFGYALLYRAVMQGVLTVGLDPSLGFFHRPRSSAYPLVLDLMELFRVPLWDMVLIGSFNRLMWKEEEDFQNAGERVILTKTGKKKVIELFESRLDEKWKHPVIGYSLSYGRMIELEVRLLEKEWSGEPGLFGRMRLR